MLHILTVVTVKSVNTFTDFNTANKHVTKLNCVKYDKENRPVKKSFIFSFLI